MHSISTGVTDAKLPNNSGREFLVCKNLLTDLQQSGRHFRLGCGKAFLSVRVFGIDNRAGGKNDFHGNDRMVRIDRWPATHTTRVVGQYATDGCGVKARRIRAHAAGVRFQHFVNPSKCSANTATNPLPVVLDFPAAPVLSHIEQDVVALRLAIQAGPAGPEGGVAAFATAKSKNGSYVIDVLRLCDHFRDIPVRAGVRRIAHQVADTMPDNILAKYLDQISLKLFRSSPSKLFVYSIRRGWYIRAAEACGVC